MLLLAAVVALVSRDDGDARSMLEESGDANRDARAELKSYSNVLSFGQHIPSRSCEGCADDEVHDDHPAEMTESLSDDSPWAHRFMQKGELYQGESKGKSAVGVDCYYTHTVSWCDAQKSMSFSGHAVQVRSHSDKLSRAQRKEQALAMDGANDYDMDCFYHHEVGWCLELHAKQKAAKKKVDFVVNAEGRDTAYSTDPELAGLASMVRQDEPISQLKEDEKVRDERSKEQKKHEDKENARAMAREQLRHEEREEKEEREEHEESADRLRREERLEARAEAHTREVRRDEAREAAPLEAATRDNSHKLERVQEEAEKEREVAKQELKDELKAQQREAAAEAELKAAKAQLHTLASKKVAEHDRVSRHSSLPALHGLPVVPAFQNAEPVEALRKTNVVVTPAHGVSEDDNMQRLHREYERQMQAKEDMSYPLSVRRQEPGGNKDVISSSISWDKAHGVRPIDSLRQVHKARAIELAELSRARSQELADFTVSRGDVAPEGRRSVEPSQLEQEALDDGLTLVPLNKASVKASSLVHKGLSSDGRWEASHGLEPVSARGSSRQAHPASGLHSLDLLKSEERVNDDWERRHSMIPFTGHKQEHSHAERILGDARVPVAVADSAQPAVSSTLVMRADAEAQQVGSAGIRALGFDNAKDFEKHLESDGI